MTSLAKGTVKIFIQTLSSKPFEGKVISLVASVDDTIENIKAKIHEEVRSSSLVQFSCILLFQFKFNYSHF